MLKLQTTAADDVRVALAGGAFVVLAPITPKMRRRALRSVRQILTTENVDSTSAADENLLGDIGEAVSRQLIRMGAKDWAGIGDENDEPLPLTPDQATRIRTANDDDRPTGTIDLLLADEDIFNALDEGYVRPDAVRRMEKNGLSGSPNGTSAGATPAKTTADSAATRKKTGAAKSAPTKNTPRRPKPAKASGKS